MQRINLAAAILVCAAFSPSIAFAQQGLPNVEQAQAISQRTGRPILAMAGQET